MSKRRKFINLAEPTAHAAISRLGIGDVVVLTSGDMDVTVTVEKLERVPEHLRK